MTEDKGIFLDTQVETSGRSYAEPGVRGREALIRLQGGHGPFRYQYKRMQIESAHAPVFVATQRRDPQRTPETRSGQSCRRCTGERGEQEKTALRKVKVQTLLRNHVREDCLSRAV